MYNITFPDQTQQQMTEADFRNFAAGLNPQQNWKVACETWAIQKVIDAMVCNGYIVTPVQ